MTEPADLDINMLDIEDEDYKAFLLRTLIKPGEAVIDMSALEELQSTLENIHYKLTYYDCSIDTNRILETTIETIKWIILGARGV